MKKKYLYIGTWLLGACYFVLCVFLVLQLDEAQKKILRDANNQQLLESPCFCAWEESTGEKGTKLANTLVQRIHPEREMCQLIEELPNKPDIVVSDLLSKMEISYPQYVYTHNGWLDRWDISYDSSQIKPYPLVVYFVLHSHNDAGWKETADTYYTYKSSGILNRMVSNLVKDPMLKFVWSEVIYLSQWYRDTSKPNRDKLKRLLSEGRLEVVSGGWVMSDEAITHYHDMLHQLVHGHNWLKSELNYTSKYSWAIDPFGHSPTMTYMLKESGSRSMLIQKAHYALKHHLGNRKQLEFYWKQAWDVNQDADTSQFCHLRPFMTYTIPYSCGPDIDVCCQFDFGSPKCWNWGKYQDAEQITPDNIQKKAEILIDQLRKTSQLFQHNVLLIPHGDDFRYDTDEEWHLQTSNLKALFKYINEHEELRIQIQFGTVADYFEAVEQYSAEWRYGGKPITFPSLTGDFFTFNDRDDQYWSGFYTSRPHLKYMTRMLQSNLRSAELLFSQALAVSSQEGRSPLVHVLIRVFRELYLWLEECRQTQALLQHHDAITGTATASVVMSYLDKLHAAWQKTNDIITRSISILLQPPMKNASVATYDVFHMTVDQAHGSAFPEQIAITLQGHTKIIAVFNPLTSERIEVIKLKVTTYHIGVYDPEGQPVPCQVNPVWMRNTEMATTEYQLLFLASIPPLGVSRYLLKPALGGTASCQRAKVKAVNMKHDHQQKGIFQVQWLSLSGVSIQNELLRLHFCNCTGLLKMTTSKLDGLSHRTEVRFLHYGTGSLINPWKDRSGAYVFMPDGPAKELPYKFPEMVVIEGPLMSSVTTYLPVITHTVTLYSTQGVSDASVEIENWTDLHEMDNYELAMRISTNIRNTHAHFYSDLNGFQVHRRQTQSRLPIQGNFYSMTSMVWVEDNLQRVSLLSAQSHGVASLHNGELEVMLDRRLMQDDWRGLNEGITDNILTLSRFRLLVETRTFHQTSDIPKQTEAGFASLLSHMTSHLINYPPSTMMKTKNVDLLPSPYQPLHSPLPCDFHLINLRSLDYVLDLGKTKFLLFLHRIGYDCDYRDHYYDCDAANRKVQWTHIFSRPKIHSVKETSLTGVIEKSKPKYSYVDLKNMQIKTFKITFR